MSNTQKQNIRAWCCSSHKHTSMRHSRHVGRKHRQLCEEESIKRKNKGWKSLIAGECSATELCNHNMHSQNVVGRDQLDRCLPPSMPKVPQRCVGATSEDSRSSTGREEAWKNLWRMRIISVVHSPKRFIS